MPEPMMVAVTIERRRVLGRPLRLSQRFLGCGERQRDEAVHLPLILDGHDAIGIEARGRILVAIRNDTGNLCRQVADHLIGQPPQARAPFDEPLPHGLDPAAKR